jgi:hypothetical protein
VHGTLVDLEEKAVFAAEVLKIEPFAIPSAAAMSPTRAAWYPCSAKCCIAMSIMRERFTAERGRCMGCGV